MANKSFATGDLVWAKMKTYPYWPAKIVDPPEHIKAPTSKKGKYCVCFFGTNDFAWIPNDCIVPHTEERALTTKSKTKTSVGLLKAIKEITDYSNRSPENETSLDSESENDASKNVSDNDASSELSPSSPEKVEKKFKKREKMKKKLNFDSFSSTDSIPSAVERENDADCALSSPDSSGMLEENLIGEKEPKVRKKCSLTKSNSNESIAASLDDRNSDDLFPSTSSDYERELAKRDPETRKKAIYMHNSTTVILKPDSEDERIKEAEQRKKEMKRKFNFPEEELERKTDLGPPKRRYYECPPTPEIEMDKGNYLCAKDIKVLQKKLGFLGINKMSAGIVKNLLLSGHNVTVWSENLEKCQPFIQAGASIAQTADDVVASCDITFGYLGDINAVKNLMYSNFGILKALEGCSKGSKGYIEMTPIDVTTALEFEKAFTFYGMKYMIAPVVGSRQIADEGSVLCLAAGDVELFTECQNCLLSFSRNVFYVDGDLEAGVKMYLIHSMLIGTTTAALAEAIALIKKCNLSFDSFYELIEMGPFSNQLALEKSHLMNSRNFQPNSILNNQLIDMKMALKLANSYQQPSVVTAHAHELFKRAKFLNYGEHDVSAVVMGTEIELEDPDDAE